MCHVRQSLKIVCPVWACCTLHYKSGWFSELNTAWRTWHILGIDHMLRQRDDNYIQYTILRIDDLSRPNQTCSYTSTVKQVYEYSITSNLDWQMTCQDTHSRNILFVQTAWWQGPGSGTLLISVWNTADKPLSVVQALSWPCSRTPTSYTSRIHNDLKSVF